MPKHWSAGRCAVDERASTLKLLIAEKNALNWDWRADLLMRSTVKLMGKS